MKDKPSVGILGAGITGLSAAWLLKKQDIDVTIYEKQGQAGGKIKTFSQNGWLVEEGPNTMLVRDKKIWDLLQELELKSHIVKPDAEAKKRYIVRNGKLHPVPMSVFGLLKSSLFSTRAKLRLLKEPFVSSAQKEDESIAEFIRRRFGSEALNYAVDPIVSGIYAGDPERLSARHTFSTLFELERTYGSIAKGLLKREKKTKTVERALISFDEGMQVLPQALAKDLSSHIHLNTKVIQVNHRQNRGEVTVFKNGEEIINKHQALVSTFPVHQLVSVWDEKRSEKRLNNLKSIEYVPMKILALGFHREQISHPLDGFGMLVPGKESGSMLGCLFSSTLFPRRAPKNHVLLTCFIGGARSSDKAACTTPSLVEEILPQLHRLLGIKDVPVFQHHFFWENAIPQYTVDYQKHLDTMKKFELCNPGLFLAGNFRGGVSVPDCITHGFDAADKVKNHLKTFTFH